MPLAQIDRASGDTRQNQRSIYLEAKMWHVLHFTLHFTRASAKPHENMFEVIKDNLWNVLSSSNTTT